MSVTGHFYYPGNLNPTAPAFLPANQHQIPLFIPRIYHPLPPPPPPPIPPPMQPIYLPVYPNFSVNLPLHLHLPLPPPPPISMTPTRAVTLLSVPIDVTESSLRRDMEVFGEVRSVQMERINQGIVTVHFYNLKHSLKAVKEIHDRNMHQNTTARGLISGRVVYAHFVFPQLRDLPGGNNQGTLVIMNLDPNVSSSTLRDIFEGFGDVKEVRETPFKKEQRFIEFYDVRDAVKALREMNGKAINGKPTVIQFSRPGGLCKKLFLSSRHFHPPPPSYHHRHHLPPPAKVKLSNANQQQQKNKKQYKKHFKRNLNDDRFTINEETIAAVESTGYRDSRTTVMIKNIPNKYT